MTLVTPHGYDALVALLGEPGAGACSRGRVTLPKGGRIACHETLAPLFQEVFDEIKSEYLTYYWQCGGIYANRAKRTSGRKSVHSWGAAVDLNVPFNPIRRSWEQNKARHPKSSYVFTPEHPIVKAFEARGFLWGGRFKRTPDPMHFQFCTGY